MRGFSLPKLKPLKFGMKTKVMEEVVQEEEDMGCSPPIQLKEKQEVAVEAEIQLVGRPASPMVAPLPLPAAAPSANKPKPWQSRFNLRMPGKLRLPSPSLPPMSQPGKAAEVAQQDGKSLAPSQPPAPSQPAAGGLLGSLQARLGRVASVQTQPTAEALGDSAQPLKPTNSWSTGFSQPQPNATFQPQPPPCASSHDAFSQLKPSTGPSAQASYQPQSYEPLASSTPQPHDQPQTPGKAAGAEELPFADITRLVTAAPQASADNSKGVGEDSSLAVTPAGVTKGDEVAASPNAPASPEAAAAPTAARMLLSPGTALSDEKRNAALKKLMQSPYPSQPERQAFLIASPEEGGAGDQGFGFGGETSFAENSFSFFGGGGRGGEGAGGGWLFEW